MRNGLSPALTELTLRHAPLLSDAIAAVEDRRNWSPFRDSPSRKFHPEGAAEAGEAAFRALLGRPFALEQPGTIGQTGAEVSPFTGAVLGITYPRSDPDALIAAGKKALSQWRNVPFEARIALCLEMAQRMYARNFEMAHAVMHTAGQSYTQAFSGSGPNALDRGIEALAYAAKAMRDVAPSARWNRPFGAEQVTLEKSYTLVPRGLALVICCASFPTWNAYPAMFANLATGNPVIVKPHPIAILPMAIVVAECRAVLVAFGLDPDAVLLSTDTLDAPVAQHFIDDDAVQIIDFTGSPRYGGHLERTVTGKLLFTETAGLNSVVLESCADLTATATAIARATCLFSAQMCTSPQNLYIPAVGIATEAGHKSFDEVVAAIITAIDTITDDPRSAAGIMGAVQAEGSVTLIHRLAERVAAHPDAAIVRHARPYAHPDYPNARTLTPMVITVQAGEAALYAEEHFGPVLFCIAAESGAAAVKEATNLAKRHGAISSYLYSCDEDFIDAALPDYAESGMNLSINLHGAMWANFAAAYSDYHVTGLNPAGNACLADLAFVAARFRIVQSRRPAKEPANAA